MVSDHELYAPIRRRWTVVLASIASFMVGLDVLVTMTALPTLHVELGAGAAGLAWTINAYEIGFAALILTGTALGDRYGRRLLHVHTLRHSAASFLAPGCRPQISPRSLAMQMVGRWR
jgi:MFS family permease